MDGQDRFKRPSFKTVQTVKICIFIIF
ncbi:hypothetical protein BpHYR1_033973 [Brachionus plicatilis]|uniref:Uncharacterized protein n=1 Tax=Brachionus plicatilis TaxID=10195 RepID=A0A3M7PD03_BRAPC|nr:hypothetical protein BpHYR1_033973 [Brachionus plicatilis]